MDLLSLALVISAAFLHAGWNFFIKTSEDRALISWWSLALGTLAFLPILLFYPPAPRQILPYALASGLVEAVYISLLVYAYRLADFSLVYPLARGTAPLLLAVWAAVFLGERLTPVGAAGLGVLLLGLITIAAGPLVSSWRAGRHGLRGGWQGIAAAGAVAVCISVYSTIDAGAVAQMDPVPYNVIIIALMTGFYTPVVLKQYGWRRLAQAGRQAWLRCLVAGVMAMLTYMLVLIAYSRGHVSYAGALRESSVMIGALLGWRFLGENLGKVRLAGAAVIFCGIFLIAFAR